jgi:hypothetical protein
VNPRGNRGDERAMGRPDANKSDQAELTGLNQQAARAARHLRRTTMFRKIALGLFAAASLSAVALAPTTASAGGGGWGWHPHHHHHWHGGPSFGIGFVGYGNDYDSCYVSRRVATPHGWRWRTVNVCY